MGDNFLGTRMETDRESFADVLLVDELPQEANAKPASIMIVRLLNSKFMNLVFRLDLLFLFTAEHMKVAAVMCQLAVVNYICVAK